MSRSNRVKVDGGVCNVHNRETRWEAVSVAHWILNKSPDALSRCVSRGARKRVGDADLRKSYEELDRVLPMGWEWGILGQNITSA